MRDITTQQKLQLARHVAINRTDRIWDRGNNCSMADRSAILTRNPTEVLVWQRIMGKNTEIWDAAATETVLLA